MPTYEYQCTECEHRFEIWQSVGEAAPECPSCGSAVRKIFHPVRVIYKGSGFYITDSRAEKAARSGKTDASEPGSAEAPAASTAEAGADVATTNGAETKTPAADATATPKQT